MGLLYKLFLRFWYRILLWIFTRPAVGRFVVRLPFLHEFITKALINRMAKTARTRPHPWSTQSSFSSWAGLTDKSWSGRHLPVSDRDSVQPSWDGEDGLKSIFARPVDGQRMCPKSTLLFATFAQYLTDGFIRTKPEKDPITGYSNKENRKQNTSNHEIDMCPLYGRNAEQTKALRVSDPKLSERGLLRSQYFSDEEYPCFLFNNGELNPDYKALDTPLGLREILINCENDSVMIAAGAVMLRDNLFAVGGDRVNSVPQVSLMNTLWLREHNRLCRELGKQNESWSDDQVFETARNIVIVEFIKVVIEDYINHILPLAVPLVANPSVAWKAPWNKPNWITTEFSLLYRWHALIPDSIRWGEKDYKMGAGYLMNNRILLENGLQCSFEDLSAQQAGELGPRNTNTHLLDIEEKSIDQGRICGLRSYNEYREYLGMDRFNKFSQISKDPIVAEQLSKAYGGNIDDVEFFVGIFCESRVANSPLPETIATFVALDAFTQALPNPLLSQHVFGSIEQKESTFSSYGVSQINACGALADIVARNIKDADSLGFIGMTQQGWTPEL